MKQTIFVIYGLPRTGTTFLFDSFVSSGCHGTRALDVENKRLKNYVTSEPRVLARLAARRRYVGYTSKNYEKKIFYAMDRVFEFNKTEKPFIVFKHPMFSGIGDILQEYFFKRNLSVLWINTTRNLLDVIASADAQDELMADLIFNTRGYLEDDYKTKFSLLFHGDVEVLPMSPEDRAVYMFRNFKLHERYVTKALSPLIFDYDDPASAKCFDKIIKKMFNIELNLAENWQTGVGRYHKTRLDMGRVKQLLEDLK